jgi:hypothetical protein
MYFSVFLMYNHTMNDFFTKYQEYEGTLQPPVLKPFVGDPHRLSLPAREELHYRYQYLEESVQELARDFRVTPSALQDYFLENNITPQDLDTPEALATFEDRVNETYKSIRIRMSGLVSIQTARAWESLAISENHLLASLEKASQKIHENAVTSFIDAKELKTLVDAHAKIVDRQQMIKEAINVPAAIDVKGLADSLSKSLESLLDEIDGESKKLPCEQPRIAQ